MSDPSNSSGRPRRSTRVPAKAPVSVAEPNPPRANGKRKGRDTEKEPVNKLEALLTSPKSKLTKIDFVDVLNYENFLDLSPESQDLLVSLLPPTSFFTYRSTISPTHVDYAVVHPAPASNACIYPDSMDVDPAPSAGSSHQILLPPQQEYQEQSTATLDPTTFTSPFFLSAAHTFQDHLFSGWLGKKAREDIEKFQAGVGDGSLHAPWKDEVWEQDHPSREKRTQSLDLSALAKQGLLREGDIISYRREFPQMQLVVEKDVLIDTIHPRSHYIRVLLPPSSTRRLHASLLINGHVEPDPRDRVQAMEDILDPVELEHGILDLDGRVSRANRHAAEHVARPSAQSSNSPGMAARAASHTAWKSFTVWRWREEMRDAVDMQALQDMGGRERFGTLFYLRAYCRNRS